MAVSFNLNAAIDAHVAEHHIEDSDHIHEHVNADVKTLSIHAKDHGHKRFSLDPVHVSENSLDFFEFIPFRGFVFHIESLISIDKIQVRLAELSYISPPSQFRCLPLLN
ncbi:hypothetical protein [Halobacteriovorax sp.]|uniref:hypothetical protein n=1 Tax=Halobacteriovorax sp. TaxID=2020862 RepID=UPI003AF27789